MEIFKISLKSKKKYVFVNSISVFNFTDFQEIF